MSHSGFATAQTQQSRGPRYRPCHRLDLGLAPHVIDQYPAELSGGIPRVALARAIADKPEILLFDEPTSGLDPITGSVIDRLIIDAVQRLGRPLSPLAMTASVRESLRRWRWFIMELFYGAVM